jgi:hypothetical protein
MKHITLARVAIALLLLICGGLLIVILRQQNRLERFTQDAEIDRHSSLVMATQNLDQAQRNVLDLASDDGKPLAPGAISDYLEQAAAYLDQAQIYLDMHETVRRHSGEPPIILFDSIVFHNYPIALRRIAGDLKRQTAVRAEQRTMLAAIDHDLGILHDVAFDHMILVQEANNRQEGQLNDQSLPRLADSIETILPTLKFNSVRHELGLFPSISPQEDRSLGANQFSLLILGASTTCAEVGQPVTFTLELHKYDSARPSISLESLDIVISGNGRQERWSSSGAAPKPDQPTLAAGESLSYEWVWTASEQFSNTTVLVEARAKLPQDSSKPTPDPNGGSQENPVMVDLKLGVGALTQTWEEQLSWHNSPRDESPRTLPCAQMVR